MLRNMMARVTTFGIVLHNIIMIANVICTRIRLILRFKKIIIHKPPLQFSVHEGALSHFNDVHCLPLPVTTDLFPDQFVSHAVVTHKECREMEGARNHLLINAPD